MRKSGLILTIVGLGAYLAARYTEQRFRSMPGRLATTFSGKYRARHELLQAGSALALKAGMAGLVLAVIPQKHRGRKRP